MTESHQRPRQVQQFCDVLCLFEHFCRNAFNADGLVDASLGEWGFRLLLLNHILEDNDGVIVLQVFCLYNSNDVIVL